ncbi:MAG: hypothetical protein ACYDC2_09255 [Solirubrobacteraceae bacterium]
MPERLFVFLQLEFPWALGPADGRYLMRDGRAGPESKPQHVVVLETLGAGKAERAAAAQGSSGRLLGRLGGGSRERTVDAEPEPAAVRTTRATVVDPVSLSAELQAQAWLDGLDRDHDVLAAVRVVNRVVQMHRIAAADAYVHEVSSAQALVIRAGWGEGEQVAYGQWLHARELQQLREPQRRRGRAWALRPQERLAALLSGRSSALLCEELALRVRLDLDQGRFAAAAVGLERALAAAAAELPAEGRQDLALRISELEQLRAGVTAQAALALERAARPAGSAGEPPQALEEDLLGHALGRLEACLRARTAPGV